MTPKEIQRTLDDHNRRILDIERRMQPDLAEQRQNQLTTAEAIAAGEKDIQRQKDADAAGQT